MKIYQNFGKRAFDIFFSLNGLILTAPLFLLLSILIKLDSKGPVFFVQKRMGLGGKPFSLIKFRTMHSSSTEERLAYIPGACKRVNRLGKLLRRTKIDELPQIINVLKGDMSFVGPRPEVYKYRDFYSGRFRKILNIRPGITDRASIKYRNEETILSRRDEPNRFYNNVILPDKLKINLEYAEKGVSFREDVSAIVETLTKIFWRYDN